LYQARLTKSYHNVKKEVETNHIKIIHPPFVVYVDENKDNIIQPIEYAKSRRHIQAIFKEQNKNGEDVSPFRIITLGLILTFSKLHIFQMIRLLKHF
jgi:hypothetical protein